MTGIVPRPPPERVWLVRDVSEDNGAPYVMAWSERPCRRKIGDGYAWITSLIDQDRGFLGSLWLADAARVFGVVPDDERQVIVMERDHAIVFAAIESVARGRA